MGLALYVPEVFRHFLIHLKRKKTVKTKSDHVCFFGSSSLLTENYLGGTILCPLLPVL